MSERKLNILFRISGGRAHNKELGMGHIYRSVNLAYQLRKYNILFLLEDYGKVTKFLKKAYLNVFQLKKGVDVQTDILRTKELIKNKKINLLIVDKFDSNTNKYVNEMRKEIKTVVISDVKKIEYDADLVIDGFIGFENKISVNKYGTECILGPKFQILNKDFEKYDNHKIKKYDILITFGGFDEHNLIDLVCANIEEYLGRIKVKIILGPITKKSRKVKLLELKYKKFVKVCQDTLSMKKEISYSKFGICSGGITSYEFAAMGIPFAIICQYKHQVETARAWQKKGVALNLGFPNKDIKNRIQILIQNFLKEEILLKPGNSIVDGLGAKRVAGEILRI